MGNGLDLLVPSTQRRLRYVEELLANSDRERRGFVASALLAIILLVVLAVAAFAIVPAATTATPIASPVIITHCETVSKK